jgi:hypothetical protein
VKQYFSKKNIVRALYIIMPVLFLLLIVGHEFFWRFESGLHTMHGVRIRDSKMRDKYVVIEEDNLSSIDTFRRELKDPKSITTLKLWLRFELRDSFPMTLTGKYFSDFRPIHISSDSSTQIMMIPNSSQGLPAGWSRIIYLKNDSTIAIKEFSGYFIGDIDDDGNEEVNIPDKGWMKLDVSTGDWIPAQLKQ